MTARDLARFLELLFDRTEREDARTSAAAAERAPAEPTPDRDLAGLAPEAVRHRRMKADQPMSLTDEQAQFYRQTLEVTKKSIDELNSQIEEELAKVKERLAELQAQQERRQADLRRRVQILGIENDLEKTEEPEA